MSTRTRIAYLLFAGLLGGAGAGGVILIGARIFNLSPEALSGIAFRDALQGGLIGLTLGIYIGAIEGIANHEAIQAMRGALISGTAGIVGGALGVMTGGTLFRGVAGTLVDFFPGAARGGVSFGLSLGWLILGACLGASSGLLVRSWQKARHGLAGGALGGMLGGIVFFSLYDRQSFFASCFGLSILGGAIGMSIALVENLLVGVVIRVKKGRHQGREYPIYAPTATIGRDDRCEVCLSGCEGVSLIHAKLRRNGGGLVIEDMSPEIGIYVNDVRRSKATLKDGDLIRVGSVLLEMKKGAAMAAAAVLLVITMLGPLPSSASDMTAKISQFDLSGYPMVRAYISILSPDGTPAYGIGLSRISIRENGRVLSVTGFTTTREEKGQFCAALVLDRSESMAGKKIERARDSVETFIRLLEAGDRAALIPFSDRVESTAPLTADKEGLISQVLSVHPGGHTALYDAVVAGVEKVKSQPGRRAVIVLTDGKANRGSNDIEQAIQAGVQGNTSIYVIGLGEDVRTERLERIAQSTGGEYFFTPSPEELKRIYMTISRQIKEEYILSYRAPETGEFIRTLSIIMDGGEKVSRPYFQPASSLFGPRPTKAEGPFWPIALTFLTAVVLGAAGLRTIEHDKLCPKCGSEVGAAAKFCRSCGTKIKT